MSQLGVAVIGAGGRGVVHARAWHEEGSAVRVVADIDEGRAQVLADEHGAEAVCHWEEAVDREDVQVVSIGVPAAFHAPVALAAMRRGKHVLCEKPAALDVADVDEMMRTAADHDLRLGYFFQRRFAPDVIELERIVAGGELGRPMLIHVTQAASIRPKLAMHDLTMNAGPVVDVMCHWLDLWTAALRSEPVRVKAAGVTLAVDRPELQSIKAIAPDTATVTVEFASGDTCGITVSWGLPPGVRPGGLWLNLGPKGAIKIQGLTFERHFEGRAPEVTTLDRGEDINLALVREFAAAVRAGREPKVSGHDGRRALAVSIAALQSLKTGTGACVAEIGGALPGSVAGVMGLA